MHLPINCIPSRNEIANGFPDNTYHGHEFCLRSFDDSDLCQIYTNVLEKGWALAPHIQGGARGEGTWSFDEARTYILLPRIIRGTLYQFAFLIGCSCTGVMHEVSHNE